MEIQHSSTSSFKKFFRFLIIVLTSCIGIGIAINTVFEKCIIFQGETSGASKINRILKQSNLDEVPIFGSSRAENHFIPSIIDKNCFNYGILGTQGDIWLFFLEKELSKNKRTKIIINFDLEGLIYAQGDIGNYIPNYAETTKLVRPNGKYYYNIPFIKYFGKFESYLKYKLSESINLTKKAERGGHFKTHTLTEARFNELVFRRKESPSQFMKEELLFKKFNQLVQSTDREIYIVVGPYHKSYLESFKNINEVNAFLSSIEAFPNVTVLDLRDKISGDSLFFDTAHLNYEGAKIFSRMVHEVLIRVK